MSRVRKIGPDLVLDAAERVIMRFGAAGLSIDAVAKEAGISKSSVVYDHKSKDALLEALIDRRISADKKMIQQAVSASRDTPHPELFGRITAAANVSNDADKAVTMAISASMANDAKLQKSMREWTEDDIHAVQSTTDRPFAALMAFLALTGFVSIEVFDFHQWTPSEREKILDGIVEIFLSFPER